MINRGSHHHFDRREADFLQEQEFVHRKVAAEDVVHADSIA
jgi:hypothetical protein